MELVEKIVYNTAYFFGVMSHEIKFRYDEFYKCPILSLIHH